MSVTIKLSQRGKKHQPFYKIVAANTRDRRDGLPIEEIGYYDPSSKNKKPQYDKTRLDYWLSKGAIMGAGLNKILNPSQKTESKIINNTNTDADKK